MKHAAVSRQFRGLVNTPYLLSNTLNYTQEKDSACFYSSENHSYKYTISTTMPDRRYFLGVRVNAGPVSARCRLQPQWRYSLVVQHNTSTAAEDGILPKPALARTSTKYRR
jgi:hypothetical protein